MQIIIGGFWEWLSSLGGFQVPIIAMMIPIIAIIVGGITALVKFRITHVERMAMIRRGMHPDAPQENQDEEPDVTRRS